MPLIINTFLAGSGQQASLNTPLASPTGATTASWSVTVVNANSGTVFAAARLATDGQLLQSDIVNGTGNAITTSSDTTVSDGAGNGGNFTGLTESVEVVIDMVYIPLTGSPSGVVSSSSIIPSGTLTASFTIGTTLTNPVNGESIGVWVVPNSESGFGVSGHEIYRNHRFEIDFGDGSATFALNGSVVPGENETARKIGGQTGSHIYWTPGNYTVTVRAWEAGNVLVAQETVAITVQDIDAIADVQIYHDPSGAFTGMPADNGTTIRRSQTWTDVKAWNQLHSSGDYVLIHTARGTTTGDGTNPTLNGASECMVVREFEDAGLTGYHYWGGTGTFQSQKNNRGRERRLVFIGQRRDGGGDPVESEGFSGGDQFLFVDLLNETSGYQNHHITFARCRFSGFVNCIASGFPNSGPDTGIWNIHLNDCHFSNYFDYPVLTGQGRIRYFAVGSQMLPNPRTSHGDPKKTGDFMVNHAIGSRTHNAVVISIAGCDAAGAAAWSGSVPDYDMQAAFRHHNMQPGMERPTVCHYRNRTFGREMLNHGDAGETIAVEPYVVNIQKAIHCGGRQFNQMVATGVGSFVVQNCFLFIPDIYSEGKSVSHTRIMQENAGEGASLQTGQSFIDSCTVINKRKAVGSGGQGGLDGWEPVHDNGYAGTSAAVTGLLVDNRHYTGGTTPTCTFSPGDLYKQVAGTLEEHTGFRPVADFGGNVRPATGNTLKGCWQETVSSVSTPAAPVNTSAPTVKTMNRDGSKHIMVNDAWNNVDDDPWLGPIGEYLWKREWFDGGTEVGDEATVYWESIYGGGFNLSGRIGYVSLAGDDMVLVSSSNSISI